MFDFYEQSEEMKDFLTKAGLKGLSYRINVLEDSYDLRDISLESFGPLDRAVVTLSIGTKNTIISCQRIDVESASKLRTVALDNADEEQLINLLAFLKKAKAVAYDDQLKDWLQSNIDSAKLALKQKL